MKQRRTDLTMSVKQSNIATAINAAHQAVKDAERSVVRHAAECGRLLNAAKATVPHGRWQAWVQERCSFSMRSAQLYMKLADHLADGDPAKAQRVADLNLREIQALLVEREAPRLNGRTLSAEARRQADNISALWYAAHGGARRKFMDVLVAKGDLSAERAERALS